MDNRRWQNKRKRIFKRDKGVCKICNKWVEKDNFSVDHIIPRCKGGSNLDNNLQLAHIYCNKIKADKVPTIYKPLQRFLDVELL